MTDTLHGLDGNVYYFMYKVLTWDDFKQLSDQTNGSTGHCLGSLDQMARDLFAILVHWCHNLAEPSLILVL